MINKEDRIEIISKGLNELIAADFENLEYLVKNKAPISKIISVFSDFDFYFSKGERFIDKDTLEEYKKKFVNFLGEYEKHVLDC